MKISISIISIIFSSVVLAGVPGIYTPYPVQSGFPDNCVGFNVAIPGDTCDSFAYKNGLDVPTFLSLNPQIGGIQGCPQNVAVYYWYCAHSLGGGSSSGGGGGGGGDPTKNAQPTRTDHAKKKGSQAPATATAKPAKTELPPVRTTPPPICPIDNDCWRAFRKAADRVKPSYSSWCTSVLQPPAILETDFKLFPGAPNMVRDQCKTLGDADTVISSYCSCYTAGQMN